MIHIPYICTLFFMEEMMYKKYCDSTLLYEAVIYNTAIKLHSMGSVNKKKSRKRGTDKKTLMITLSFN